MKRRIFEIFGTVALTGAFALSAGTATADSDISLEEDYTFSSATQMTYTLKMKDSSGTRVTKEACDRAKQSAAKSLFTQVGSSTTCAISQDADPEDTAKILKVTDNTFTFESQSRTILGTLGSSLGLETLTVTAHFPKGYRIESALVPDGGDTEISSEGASVTWTGVSSSVHSEGSIHSSSSSKWIVLGILALLVVGGISAFIFISTRKNKKNQQQPDQHLQQGYFPLATQQQIPSEDAQAPQQHPLEEYPEQRAQPGQQPQA